MIHIGIIDPEEGEVIILIIILMIWIFKRGKLTAQLLLLSYVMPGHSAQILEDLTPPISLEASTDPLFAFTYSLHKEYTQ